MDDIESIFPDHLSTNCVLRLDHFYQAIVGNFWQAPKLQAAFGTTDSDPHTITLPDALASLSRLCLLHYPIDSDTTVTRLPRPDVRQKEILTALGVALPEM